MEDNDLLTDDEALRVVGMTDGAKSIPELQINLRPMTALSLSWMQRNNVFDESDGDMMQKTSAFAYLHSAEKSEIRTVVNSRDKFFSAVDDWLDENIQHHAQLEPLAEEMNTSFETYMAAQSKGGSPYKGDGAKN